MLDNPKEIAKRDQSNMRKLLLQFPSQCQKAIQLAEKFTIPEELFQKSDKIVVSGLGGSAIGGDILKTLLKQSLEIPILVNRSYTLPATVNKKTLIFIISYSGNTEETLTTYKEAMARKSRLISICGGGKLKELSEKDRVPCLLVPTGMPPRTTIGYLFIPLLKILERLKWANIDSQDYDELIKVLNDIRDRYGPKVPLSENPAKALSQKLLGKIPLIYGVEGKTDVVAHRLKTQFNENSKIIAFWDAFPELSHNEIVAWGKEGKVDFQQFYSLFIRDVEEGERIKKRIEITQSIITERKVGWEEIWTEGKDHLARVFSAIYKADWLSFYLAILQGIDPTPVKMIDLLKKELDCL